VYLFLDTRLAGAQGLTGAVSSAASCSANLQHTVVCGVGYLSDEDSQPQYAMMPYAKGRIPLLALLAEHPYYRMFHICLSDHRPHRCKSFVVSTAMIRRINCVQPSIDLQCDMYVVTDLSRADCRISLPKHGGCAILCETPVQAWEKWPLILA
jgi:hypothetical protein